MIESLPDPSDDQGVLSALDALATMEQTDQDVGRIPGVIGVRLIARMIRRILVLENSPTRAVVVDSLPANAPLGVLIVLRGDPDRALYVGRGATSPLARILPSP